MSIFQDEPYKGAENEMDLLKFSFCGGELKVLWVKGLEGLFVSSLEGKGFLNVDFGCCFLQDWQDYCVERRFLDFFLE
jgi:hypothetical protein